MSFGGHIRRTIFWLKDRVLHKGIVKKQYMDIKKILDNYDYGSEQMESYLSNIIDHATRTTKFYREFQNKPFYEFPVINKSIINEKYEDFVSKLYLDKKVHTMSTSGSTGTPFTVMQNFSKRSRVIAELKLFGELCGYRSHEKMVFLRILSEKTQKSKVVEWAENIYRIDSTYLSKKNMREANEFIMNKNIEAIISYGSTFDYLVDFIQDKGYCSNDYKVKTIIAGGEAISINTRKKLKLIFGDKCNIVSRYSNMEMGILGQDSCIGSGFLLNHGSYFFECLKYDNDKPAENGEVGRIVITDLFNYAFPLIRYDTGDTGIMEYGKNSWSKIKEIYGKQRDVIFNTKGEPVSPVTLSVFMWGVKGIKQWQFIQEGKGDYCLKINGIPHDIERIIKSLKKVIGLDAQIDIKYVEEIPLLDSNKRRHTVCNLKEKQIHC